jgi:hypothetical protein
MEVEKNEEKESEYGKHDRLCCKDNIRKEESIAT